MAVLPIKDRRYLTERNLRFEEVEGTQKAVVLRGFELPSERFDAANADFLILLPAAYPDCAPDMFFALPWLRLAGSGSFPRAADVAHAFGGQSWQRWSRHSDAWRPGVDGIWTMIKRLETALAVAA
jgi:hypothetical protein